MSTICTNPKKPKKGYNTLTKLEKPILETNTDEVQINKFSKLYDFLLFVQFCNNPYPQETAEVKIEISKIKP